MSIVISFKLPALYRKQDNWYISKCPILDVYSQGKSKEKAKANLKEAVTLFIESCLERGVLPEVLTASGFKVSHRKAVKTKGDTIDVAIPLVSRRSGPATASV
jgi:predicted RNase H-like HicB family nuclease